MARSEVIVPLTSLSKGIAAPRDTLARPVRDLRISVMDRCNFRCPYCMPRETFHEKYKFLGSHERLSFDEIVRLSRLFVQLGVRKLRLTGGEPLLRANLADLIGDLTAIPDVEDVALTTNGVLLARYAAELKAAGLRRITVSLDTLDPEIFARMSGGFGGIEDVLNGIEHARQSDLTPIKVNAVIQRGVNDHTALDLVRRFRGTGVIVRFIEYMDVGNRNAWREDLVVPSKELAARISEVWPLHPVDREYRGEVAQRYAFDDGQGEVGFISSVTQPFCGDCSRARLSSDGVVYTCLFATQGTSVRDALRSGASDEHLLEILRNIWLARSDRYSEVRSRVRQSEEAKRSDARRKVEMFYIGG
jgi:cyclic pyranopterin phosphate synthase